MNKNRFILLILLAGILFRLLLTAGGNFLFNMDNARDMVDVREMVVLHKPRLTGPTSAIEGLYNGPAWYYLLALPFILSGGDPYASIIMEIILWAVGGFFLLKLVSRWSNFLILPAGMAWIASDYIVLTNLYAFNPNPVTLLAPLFIYLLHKYLEKGKIIFGISTWFLGGLFFNFEMNFGIFTPVIILGSLIITKKFNLIKNKWFFIAPCAFIITILPQIFFDLKHNFIMSRALIRHLSENSADSVIIHRIQIIADSFFNTFSATLMNHKSFSIIILLFFIPVLFKFIKHRRKDNLFLISLIFVSVPFFGYLILPVTVNAWHLGGEMAVSLILISYLLSKVPKFIGFLLSIFIIYFAFLNIANFFINDFSKPGSDPSLYRNETAAIDYVYKYANGRNFKVYTYLPSVYDYPYQYLFWWYGQKKYGYIPGEYVYSPNKPVYIPGQAKFQGNKNNLSNLIFLIEEPDRNDTRAGWEGAFVKLKTLDKIMVGSVQVQIRTE